VTPEEMLQELQAAALGWPDRLLALGAGLAEEGRGLGALLAAERVYTGRSGRGTLGRSIRGRATAGPSVVEVEWTAGEAGTPAADYARVQELGTAGLPGGGIRPRRGRFLAIPTALATAGGLTSPREVQNPRWIPRKAGGWFVVGPAGVLFVLHPGPITLPAKGYLRDAVAEVVRVVPQRLPLAVLMGLEAA
jgi:hypothetical protein